MIEFSHLLLNLLYLSPLILALVPLKLSFNLRLSLALVAMGVICLWRFDDSITWAYWFYGLEFQFTFESLILTGMALIVWGLYWVKNAQANTSQRADSLASHRESPLLLILFFVTICACLVTDLVSFYLFNVIASYSFYTLLINQADRMKVRRAAKHFLIIAIASDLILFEALVIANKMLTSANPLTTLSYPTQVNSSYTYFVLLGFTLKCGGLFFGWWISNLMRHNQNLQFLPVVSIPLAMIGLVRWLPASEMSQSPIVTLTAIIAALTFCYFVYLFVTLDTKSHKLQSVTIALISGYFTLFAVAQSNPEQWHRYSVMMSLSIAIIGIWTTYATNFIVAKKSENTDEQSSQPVRIAKGILYFRWVKFKLVAQLRSLIVGEPTANINPAESNPSRLQTSIEVLSKLRFHSRLAVMLILLVIFLLS